MLFDPAAHEPISGEPWDEQRVRAAVREIVAEAERTYDPVSGWPLHPLDSDGDDDHAWVSHGIYLGVAGVLWALHFLARADAVELSIDLERAGDELNANYLGACRLPDEPVPSLWLGEAGVHLVAEVISPDTARHQALLASVRANAHNETLEFLWGAPGTMLAAREMHRRTGDECWAAAWRESADALWDEWRVDERLGCSLWTQDLYGRSEPLLGAGHGFAGNVFALFEGVDLLEPERRDELVRRATATTVATAVTEDGLANWSPVAGPTLGHGGTTRTQWCHGAPGMICSLAGLPSQPELDALLTAGAELTWQAGPLVKGPGLCHGTAGNGFALLALLERSGDEVWLHRARTFAMHSLAQVEHERRRHGRGRFTLWTGDLGAAVYAWQCLEVSAALPAFGTW